MHPAVRIFDRHQCPATWAAQRGHSTLILIQRLLKIAAEPTPRSANRSATAMHHALVKFIGRVSEEHIKREFHQPKHNYLRRFHSPAFMDDANTGTSMLSLSQTSRQRRKLRRRC